MESRGQSVAATTITSPSRTETPDSDRIDRAPPANPFASPYGSMPASVTGSSTGFQTRPQAQLQPQQRFFHSRRIVKGQAEKPWLDKKDPRKKWVWIIPIIGVFLGLGLTGYLIYDGMQTISNHVYCPVLNEDWSGGFNNKVWTKEVESGGFGNGEFEVTTNTDENAYIANGMLHIKPTLQDANLIMNNNTVNLTKEGICSSTTWNNCVSVTNTTNGTIVNPVKSARINSRMGATIKYGRVEVTAQLPAGDWLWPAIWMLPVNATKYGVWPASGEIDIMESRGNNYTYPQGGSNIMSSTLHWGPDAENDAWWQNNRKQQALHSSYADGFHIFGLEWTEKYMFTYVDTRLLQVLYTRFDQPFWKKGNFPVADKNGTRLIDPWSQTGRDSTPFDQDFYLILNVAVGSTNGWFDDGVNGKPWVDASPTARKDFWEAKDQWYPTWKDRGQMVIKSVKMWQQKGYNGC